MGDKAANGDEAHKTNGIIVRLNKKRYKALKSDRSFHSLFEEPVDDFKIENTTPPLLVFIFRPDNQLVGIGLGSKGDRVGTGMCRLTIHDITYTENLEISADHVYHSRGAGIYSRTDKIIENRLAEGGLLTPKASIEFIRIVSSLKDELKDIIDELITYEDNLKEKIKELGEKAQALSNQRDGFAMALYGSGHDPKLLSHWHTRHHPAYITKGTGSYFNGLDPRLFKPLDKKELCSLFPIPGFKLMLGVPGSTTIIYREKIHT